MINDKTWTMPQNHINYIWNKERFCRRGHIDAQSMNVISFGVLIPTVDLIRRSIILSFPLLDTTQINLLLCLTPTPLPPAPVRSVNRAGSQSSWRSQSGEKGAEGRRLVPRDASLEKRRKHYSIWTARLSNFRSRRLVHILLGKSGTMGWTHMV